MRRIVHHPAAILSVVLVPGVLGACGPSEPNSSGALGISSCGSTPTSGASHYEPQTGKTIQGAFLEHWQATGGLAGSGFPITDVFESVGSDGRTYQTQCFERRVFEFHPENADCRHHVLGRHLGRQDLARRHGDSPPWGEPPSTDDIGRRDEVTGKFMSRRMLAHWEQNGGLEENGRPLTDEVEEDGLRVQYFERAVFEYHPENAPPHDIQGRLLGWEDPDCQRQLAGPSAAGGGASRVEAPDLKVTLHIRQFDANAECIDLLRWGINCAAPPARSPLPLGIPTPASLPFSVWGMIQGLAWSANPEPPHVLDASSWRSFEDSKEYRGYIHVAPLGIECSGGVVTGLDQANEERSYGFTKTVGFDLQGMPSIEAAFDAGELFSGSGISQGNRWATGVGGSCAKLDSEWAARVSTKERAMQYYVTGYDAPFVWAKLHEQVCCDGSVDVQVEHSHFPTSRLYVDGQTVDVHEQRDLGKFIVSGGPVFNLSGIGPLAGANAPMTWSRRAP